MINKTVPIFFTAAFLVLNVSLVCFAQTPEETYSQGRDFFMGQNGARQNQSKGLELMKQAADHGSLKAQKFLGDVYLWGDYAPVFPIDIEQAILYLSMAANQGDAQSMAFLANAYGKRIDGNIQNEFDAFRWYLKAAEAGFERAYYPVGEGYFYGKGVQINKPEAAKWLRKAAEFGNAWAQYLLGYMLRDGIEIEKNLPEAVMWLEKAVAQGNNDAQLQLGLIYLNGWDNIEKDTVKSLTLLQQSALAGNQTAQTLLGSFFLAPGPTQNLKESFRFYQMAADQGSAEALLELAKFYLNEKNPEKNPAKAAELLEQAVAQGNMEAQSLLALLRREGIGIQKDVVKASNETLIAAHKGDKYAQYDLGLSYYFGRGQEQNSEQAFLWFEKAAMQGDGLAQIQVGKMLYEGDGVLQNKARGLTFYQKAAAQGEEEAIFFLKSKGLEIPPHKETIVSEQVDESSALNIDNWGSL